MTFGGYLRPSETFGIRACDSVAPVGFLNQKRVVVICPEEELHPTKTGAHDEGVIWGNVQTIWLSHNFGKHPGTSGRSN